MIKQDMIKERDHGNAVATARRGKVHALMIALYPTERPRLPDLDDGQTN